jgi:selenocysteine lyase/cysteine desulfurase
MNVKTSWNLIDDNLFTDVRYKGFGSFHSDNVEDLISLPDSEYHAPERPAFALAVRGANGLPTRMDFGDPMFLEHFMMSPDYLFVNHGAFGGALRGGVAIKRAYEDLMEEQILAFVDRKLLPWIVYSTRQLAKFLNCSPQNLALVQNATFGINSAMHLIEKGNVVCYLDTEYLAVYKILWTRCEAVGATLKELPVTRMLHRSDIMASDEALTAYLESLLPVEGCDVIVLDFITSTTAMLFPVLTHIVPMLRRRGVRHIIVDGAHAPMQVSLDLDSLPDESRPSVLVGNLHKWFCCPKSVGFLWVRDDCKALVHPAVLSHGTGDGFLSEFVWDGTKDYGSYLSIPAIADFWALQGVDRVQGYCTALLASAVTYLNEQFGGRVVPRRAPFFSLVELPEALQAYSIDGEKKSSTAFTVTAKFVQDVLHEQYRVEVPVKTVESRLYMRISAFVYNTITHYECLAKAILDLAERVRKRKRTEATTSPAAQDAALAEEAPQATAPVDTAASNKKPPCSEKMRREGGCGLSGLEPAKRKTKKF